MSGPTYDDVVKLLGHSAYNPAIVPQLEAYVKAQASSKAPYYFNANRTLVKLYQFFPHLSAGDEIISLVLFLALVEFPTTVFCALAPWSQNASMSMIVATGRVYCLVTLSLYLFQTSNYNTSVEYILEYMCV